MHKGTLFLLVLLIVILASSMVFGNFGALEGAIGHRVGHNNNPHLPPCTGENCRS
jgi:hypothetical protein